MPPNGHISVEPIILGGTHDDVANDPYGFRKWNRRIKTTHNAVLQWCNGFSGLTIWHYPVLNGARVPPSSLNWYFQHFEYRPPSCLCASQDPEFEAHTDAVIFMVTNGGPLSGEYVAACAAGKCHYFVLIEKLYSRRGLPIATHNPRPLLPALPITAGPPSGSQASGSTIFSQVLGRRRRSNSDAENVTPMRRTKAPCLISTSLVRRSRLPKTQQSSFKLLMCMDSVSKPGITEKQFKSLFRRCAGCNLFMTARSFQIHECEVGEELAVQEIIDLTGLDD